MKATVAGVGSIKTHDLIAGLVAINCRDYLESYRGRGAKCRAREIVAERVTEM